MKRATKDEAIRFIKEMMSSRELVFTEHIRLILEKVFPFSWHRYCEKKNLNSKILMDKYEKKSRKKEEK